MSLLIRESHANNDVPLFVRAGSSGGGILPAGVVMEFAGAVPPPGFILCQGQALSRTVFDELFSVIGATYGPGDGTTTYNIPNMQGRTVRGAGSGPFVLGATGGVDSVTLSTDQIPAHIHSITDPGHLHTLPPFVASTNATAGSLSGPAPGQAYSNIDGAAIIDMATAVTGITATNNNATTGVAVSLQNPFIALNYMIKFTSQNL